MTTGQIIILNGPSSSGKTSIVKTLQVALDEPFLDAGIDKFLWMLPRQYLAAPLWHEVFDYVRPDNRDTAALAIKAGPLGRRLVSGMHRAIAALAQAGNNVITEHALIEPQWLQECLGLFDEARTLFVGVRCPLDILEQRERERDERTSGRARAQFDLVHAHGLYDLEVDSSVYNPLECAWQIQHRLQHGPPPHAFKMLKKRPASVNLAGG